MSEQIPLPGGPVTKSQARRRRRQRAKSRTKGTPTEKSPQYGVRWPTPEDEDRVRELVQPANLGFDLDLSELAPYWIVGTLNDEIVVCVQICYSKPFARLETMCWDPSTPSDHRKEILKMGLNAVIKHLLDYGCQGYFSVVSSDQPEGFIHTLEKHGYQLMDDGAKIYSLRLR